MSGCRGSQSQSVAAGEGKAYVLGNANVLELDSANVALWITPNHQNVYL